MTGDPPRHEPPYPGESSGAGEPAWFAPWRDKIEMVVRYVHQREGDEQGRAARLGRLAKLATIAAAITGVIAAFTAAFLR